MKCSALAIVVNFAEGLSDTKITHEETLHYTDKVADSVANLTKEYIKLVNKKIIDTVDDVDDIDDVVTKEERNNIHYSH